MSANRFARAKPLGRYLAALNGPSAASRRRFLGSTTIRQSIAGNGQEHRHQHRKASTWSVSGVAGVAMTAGLLGWGLSELRHGGFPGAVLFDSGFSTPRYASMREMEQVCKNRLLKNSRKEPTDRT